WLAQMVQHPQQKVPASVVLRSKSKGIGKSMLAGYLRRIFGQHGTIILNKEQLFGRFNSATAMSVFCCLEEAVFAGSPVDKSRLKQRISEEETLLERKGVDAIMIPSFTRYLINSNEDHVVPVDIQERRYFVLNIDWDIPDRDAKVAYF